MGKVDLINFFKRFFPQKASDVLTYPRYIISICNELRKVSKYDLGKVRHLYTAGTFFPQFYMEKITVIFPKLIFHEHVSKL